MRAVERQCPHVYRLARLINGLLGSKQNRRFVFQPHLLGEFRLSDRRRRHVVQGITADHPGGKTELRLRRSARIQPAREKHARLPSLGRQFDAHRTGSRNRIVL